MYKSQELLEIYTCFDISTIIFWQMMNGVEYSLFKCCKNKVIDNGNYSLIKTKKCDKFWKNHDKCNMISQKQEQQM